LAVEFQQKKEPRFGRTWRKKEVKDLEKGEGKERERHSKNLEVENA
jgi:hypothetical protein